MLKYTIRCLFLISFFTQINADTPEDRSFPADAGVIDVTQAPYFADPTGSKDSTAALQAALDRYPSGNRIIYLPKGTYLISDTLNWPKGKSEAGTAKRTILEGESMTESILKLQDHCPGFQEDNLTHAEFDYPMGKAMLWTGKAPAQRFRNAVRNLTLNVGEGNPGAIGMQFNASNQGGFEDLIVRAGKDSGRIGIDLGYTGEIGPLLGQRVTIEGFDIGISIWGAVNSITLGQIQLSGQREAGILNDHQVLSIENLYSQNTVPALVNKSGDGVVVLLGAELTGVGNPQTAIVNNGVLRVQSLKQTGYALSIQNMAGTKQDSDASELETYLSHSPTPDFFQPEEPVTPLTLPVEKVPVLPWGPMDGWVNPESFGAVNKDGLDDTAAIQQAIDSGAHTVYLPNGTWQLSGTLYLRGNVRRFIGCEAQLMGEAVIEVVDGTAPVVIIERFELLPIHEPGIYVRHTSDRTLVLSHMRMRRKDIAYEAMPGAGNVFLEDVAGNSWKFVEGQKAWARQINPESATPMLINEGADLWILGLKTENDGPGIEAIAGRTEVASAFIYANSRREKNPLFVIHDGAEFSVTYGESSFRGFPFRELIKQTRSGETKTLTPDQALKRGEGSAIGLYRAL